MEGTPLREAARLGRSVAPSAVGSIAGELGPEGDYEAAEWWRFEAVARAWRGYGLRAKAEAPSIEELRAETDRISEGFAPISSHASAWMRRNEADEEGGVTALNTHRPSRCPPRHAVGRAFMPHYANPGGFGELAGGTLVSRG